MMGEEKADQGANRALRVPVPVSHTPKSTAPGSQFGTKHHAPSGSLSFCQELKEPEPLHPAPPIHGHEGTDGVPGHPQGRLTEFHRY